MTTQDPSINRLNGRKDLPGPFDTPLIGTCEAAMAKPLSQLTTADMQALLSQGIAPEHIVPRALRALDLNPLVEARHYPGDLFDALLTLPAPFWADNTNLWTETSHLLANLDSAYAQATRGREAFLHAPFTPAEGAS